MAESFEDLPNAFPEFLNQVCVYWRKGAVDGFGSSSFAAGVDMACRWENHRQLSQSANGDQIKTSCKVNPEGQVYEGDYLFLGSIASLTAEQIADPRQVPDAKMVFSVDSVPDVDGTSIWHTCFLS